MSDGVTLETVQRQITRLCQSIEKITFKRDRQILDMKTFTITCLFYLCLALLLPKTRMSLPELDDLTGLTTDGSCKMKNNINTGKRLDSVFCFCFCFFFPTRWHLILCPKQPNAKQVTAHVQSTEHICNPTSCFKEHFHNKLMLIIWIEAKLSTMQYFLGTNLLNMLHQL